MKLAAIIVFPFLVLIAFFASLNVSATNGPLFPNVGGFGGLYFTTSSNLSSTTFIVLNESSVQNSSFPNLFPQIPESLLILLILVIFAGTSLAVISSTRRRNISLAGGFEEGTVEDQRKQVATILEQTVLDLRGGGEYRETVLECYRKISELLEAWSKIDGRLLTAREFEAALSDRLKFKSPYLTQITMIFEDARYSTHEISEREADLAINCLTQLSTALRSSDSPTPTM